MNHHQALRLTPSNSPFKTTTPRSPIKTKNEEPGLRLKKVIGTTATSANGFDCLPFARQFAYTAGAAAVVCTVDEDLQVTQRFFRARPTLAAGFQDAYGPGPITPTPNEARSRVLGNIRGQGIGGSPLSTSTRDWSDSPIGKTATAKERVKAATSVALSPNGKWVAVGETGYKPRILIFSNIGDSSELPVCALAEHTFGVHALAFSPDSKYLASLGTVNDGFLYIWTIDDRNGSASLHSSNKCTVMINAMTWVGQSVLTVGLRYVKLWRPEDGSIIDPRNSESTGNMSTPRHKGSEFGNSILSPRHRFLPGKNCLLGDLIDATFVAALAITSDKAIACTESGEVCILHNCQSAPVLTVKAVTEFRVSSARLDESVVLLVTGASGQTQSFELSILEQQAPLSPRKNRRQTITPSKALPSDRSSTIATATISDIGVNLNSGGGIRLHRPANSRQDDPETISHQLAAHNNSVLGVRPFVSKSSPDAAFLTFSANGSIQIWDANGAAVANLAVPIETSPEMYDMTNELRAVEAVSNTSLLAAGDKYGSLSLLDISEGSVVTKVRAHSTEVIDIVTIERSGAQLLATASRDRTIQLFACSNGELNLLQTMDEHAAAVTSLLVARNGELLLSCSTDRTVVIRELMTKHDDPTTLAFAMLKTINLKSSPTSMCLMSDNESILVSTTDRFVGIYSFKSGQAGFNFKCSDSEGGESATLSKIQYSPSLNGNPTIIGVSSGDKSVRLYSEYGALIARDWGHTEGITDVALLPPKAAGNDDQDVRAQLVTVAADSTIFMWDTVSQASNAMSQAAETNGSSDTPIANRIVTPMGPPLRKVLSFSELSRFTRQSSAGEEEPSSPPAANTPTQAPAPLSPRVKKKTSRMTVAQPPRLEPAFRSGFAEPLQRRRRSPSPTSPRGSSKKEASRRPSLGMSLRSKSSENVLSSYATPTNASGFGSMNSSTESVSRTLRAYRKKLSSSSRSNSIAPEMLRELEKELKLTARVVGEKSQGKGLDEAMMTKLLDQASEKIVSRLDEHIKERVESEVRRSSEGSPSDTAKRKSITEAESQPSQDVVVGALENLAIE